MLTRMATVSAVARLVPRPVNSFALCGQKYGFEVQNLESMLPRNLGQVCIMKAKPVHLSTMFVHDIETRREFETVDYLALHLP
jgi:uncharacterized membrane protein